MSQDQNLMSWSSFKTLHQIRSVQETQWLCSVRFSLTLRTKNVQRKTVFIGSEPGQMNLIPVWFTLLETKVMTVRRVLRLDLHRNVSTASLRTSAPLMLGLITALWPHVERYFMEMEQNWTLKVITPCFYIIKVCLTVSWLKFFVSFHNVSAVNTCDSQTDNTVLFLVCAALAISLVVIVFLIHAIRKKSFDRSKGKKHFFAYYTVSQELTLIHMCCV